MSAALSSPTSAATSFDEYTTTASPYAAISLTALICTLLQWGSWVHLSVRDTVPVRHAAHSNLT
jgi:hypothetical protein